MARQNEHSQSGGNPVGYAWVSVTVFAYLASNIVVQALIQERLQYKDMWIVALIGNAPPLLLFLLLLRTQVPQYAKSYMQKAIPMALINLFSSVSYNSALGFARLSTVTVLTSTAAIFTLGFEFLLLRDAPVRPVTIAAAFISTLGCAVVSADVVDPEISTDRPNETLGVSLALISALLTGLFSVLLKALEISDFTFFLPCMSLVVLATGPFAVSVQAAFGKFFAPSILVCLAILLNGTLGVSGNFAQMKAISNLSPVVVNVAMTTLIPLSILWDAISQQKMPSLTFMIGAFIVLSATALVAFAPAPPPEQFSDSHSPSLVPDEVAADDVAVPRDRQPLLATQISFPQKSGSL